MQRRLVSGIACVATVVVLLLYARFRASLPGWLKANGGGVPYVVFWILLWFTICPKRRFIVPICVGCVLMTCLLEFGQLWNPEPLAGFRKTKVGAAWLGSTFVWDDFPPYFIGGAVGYFVLLLLTRLTQANAHPGN